MQIDYDILRWLITNSYNTTIEQLNQKIQPDGSIEKIEGYEIKTLRDSLDELRMAINTLTMTYEQGVNFKALENVKLQTLKC